MQQLSKQEQEQRFEEGYQIAFDTTTKRPRWDRVVPLWKAAANAGHVRAQFYLGTCYDNGYYVSQDAAQAYRWFFKAARAGHPDAQYNVAMYYRDGDGPVRVNMKAAVRWFCRAATQGVSDAQLNMGYACFYGEGIPQDRIAAVEWYRRAAAQGNEKALCNLGLCYRDGAGVTPSKRWARYYFEKSMRAGHKEARLYLQLLYRNRHTTI